MKAALFRSPGVMALESVPDPALEPPFLLVFPDANARYGHHLFVDSAVNGPVERAFIEELVPAIESRFGGIRPGRMRF